MGTYHFTIQRLINYLVRSGCFNRERQTALFRAILYCTLSFSVLAFDNDEQVTTSYELGSMTLGTQWVVPTPSLSYMTQSGDCISCYPYYSNFWYTEGYDAGYSRFRSHLKIRYHQDEPGCSIPRACTPGHARAFMTINSTELRRKHAQSLPGSYCSKAIPISGPCQPVADIFHYCLQLTPTLWLFRKGRPNLKGTQVPATMVFCFSEMPVPEPLVVHSRNDYLGDHDCGVYPPRGTSQYTHQNESSTDASDLLSDLDLLYLNMFHETPDTIEPVLTRQAVDIRFLSGGTTYRQLVVVTSGKALLELLPVSENTIIILRPDNSAFAEPTASGSGQEPAWIKKEPVFDAERRGTLKYKLRLRAPERLNQTESYPQNLGQRNASLQITAQDISDHRLHHPPELPQAGIDLAQTGIPTPALMIIGQGDGVKLDIDAQLPQLQTLFNIQGPVQLYNIDLEASLPPDSYLFQVNHYLQMYRTSVHLNTPGKLFTGNGLVTASRSVLQESPVLSHNGQEEQEDHCLLIRACRSDIHLNDWQVTPDELIAVNNNFTYFEDFLKRAEWFLPQKPLDYPHYTFDYSPLRCSQVTSQALVATNEYAQLTYFPTELREILCPEAGPPVPYNRTFNNGQPALPAAQWQSGHCRECGHFIQPGTDVTVTPVCSDELSGEATVAATPTPTPTPFVSLLPTLDSPMPDSIQDKNIQDKNEYAEQVRATKTIGIIGVVALAVCAACFCAHTEKGSLLSILAIAISSHADSSEKACETFPTK